MAEGVESRAAHRLVCSSWGQALVPALEDELESPVAGLGGFLWGFPMGH